MAQQSSFARSRNRISFYLGCSLSMGKLYVIQGINRKPPIFEGPT